jgi:hypothetical protein
VRRGAGALGEARGVFARDPALVGRLVQDRQVVAGIARDEDRRASALHRVAVEPRHAARVEREGRLPRPRPATFGERPVAAST